MKTIHLLTIIGLASCHAFATTADELADFLGISTWKSTIELPAGSFVASLHEFEHGKPINASQVEFSSSEDSNRNPEVRVMSGRGDKFFRITLSLANGTKGGAIKPFSGVTVTTPLPAQISEGDYILIGEPIMTDGAAQLKNRNSPDEYQRGLLLRIKKKELTSRWT